MSTTTTCGGASLPAVTAPHRAALARKSSDSPARLGGKSMPSCSDASRTAHCFSSARPPHFSRAALTETHRCTTPTASGVFAKSTAIMFHDVRRAPTRPRVRRRARARSEVSPHEIAGEHSQTKYTARARADVSITPRGDGARPIATHELSRPGTRFLAQNQRRNRCERWRSRLMAPEGIGRGSLQGFRVFNARASRAASAKTA
mmetsp:Transcript_25676/g.82973  ORF Transcript_25676/g.82973 Transcript_25676/m.82973 type:complete len:204 (+) Transcript_25676:436-1047(+)